MPSLHRSRLEPWSPPARCSRYEPRAGIPPIGQTRWRLKRSRASGASLRCASSIQGDQNTDPSPDAAPLQLRRQPTPGARAAPARGRGGLGGEAGGVGAVCQESGAGWTGSSPPSGWPSWIGGSLLWTISRTASSSCFLGRRATGWRLDRGYGEISWILPSVGQVTAETPGRSGFAL